MLELIKEIIGQFGGRYSGSREEFKAQQFYKEHLKGFCDKTELMEFSSALRSKFGSLPFFCLILYTSFILYWFNFKLALGLSVLNAIIFIGHFVTYYNWLDVFFKKHKSWNVAGYIKPKKEVKQVIVISGHMDSVYEFKWWYRLNPFGIYLTFIASLVIVFQAIVFLCIYLFNEPREFTSGWALVAWFVLVVLSPSAVTLFDMHGKKIVDGAIDNLSGVAIASGVGRYFSNEDKRLNHIELRVLSFGSEEMGLKGSQAYAKKVISESQDKLITVLNVDTIRSPKHFNIIKAEHNPFTFYNKELISELERAFKKENVAYKVSSIGIGATDGTSFHRKGIPTLSMIGIDTKKPDPTYHTRLDTVDNLDPEGLVQLKKVLCGFISERDRELNS